jgi:hypothetical protein
MGLRFLPGQLVLDAQGSGLAELGGLDYCRLPTDTLAIAPIFVGRHSLHPRTLAWGAGHHHLGNTDP